MDYDNVIYPFMEENKKGILKNIVCADRVNLFDKEGKKYLDGISGLWNVALGYNNKNIEKSIINQLEKIPFVNLWSNTNDSISMLANKLIAKTNGLSQKVMYTCTGSEAVELSIKFARNHYHKLGKHNKKYVIGLDLSYHGTTYGAISLTGIDHNELQSISPLLEGIALIKTPKLYNEDKSQYKNYLEEFFRVNNEKIAAIILEPVLGVAGVVRIDDEYMQLFSELCKKYDILLIMDEITTAFYRTGPFFAYQGYKSIEPDMILVSKALTNGYLPLGGVLIGKKIVDRMADNEAIPHLSTQNGNPICCAAALEVIRILEEEDFSKNNIDKSVYFRKLLKSKLVTINNIKEIRTEGMMFAIELRDKEGNIMKFSSIWEITELLKENGLLGYPYSTYKTSGLILMPPYIINELDMEEICQILYKTFIQYFYEDVDL